VVAKAREAGSARDLAAVDPFIERFTQVLVDAGMPRIASRILVVLLSTDAARLSAAELAQQVRSSPAAISGGVRYLVQLGLIHRGREPGSRRDHYHVDDDVWYQTITQRDQLMSRFASSLREGARVMGEGTAAGSRFAESVAFFEFIQTELQSLVERWEAYRLGRQPAP
jgi:DNA-binding transcriptional regulator GbsR (MarR family)